jgi:hypothetical protein
VITGNAPQMSTSDADGRGIAAYPYTRVRQALAKFGEQKRKMPLFRAAFSLDFDEDYLWGTTNSNTRL